MNVPLNLLMTTSFLLGLTVDIFSDTPGMNALSCTLLSVLKRPILLAYCQHDDTLDEITPCCQTLGLWTYSKYALTMTLVYCIFYFGIEFFAIESIWQIALTALCSTMLSAILIVGIDSILLNHREKRL